MGKRLKHELEIFKFMNLALYELSKFDLSEYL